MKLKFECPLTWNDLAGTSTIRRHCDRCDHAVYNLSGMTRDQARRALALHEGAGKKMCVHFVSRNGQIVHDGDPLLQLEGQRRGAGKLLAAALLVQTAFAIVADEPSDFYFDPFAAIGVTLNEPVEQKFEPSTDVVAMGVVF